MQQGEGFREFTTEYNGGPAPATEAVRMINSQSEEIVESLNGMKGTTDSRRQVMIYLLEQCILLGSALPVEHTKERIRFRRIRRLVEKARRLATRQ
jgi:hypothetical protein